MQAITIPVFGDDVDSLVLAEVDDPVPGPGDVLIDVSAAGVNRADLLQRRGFYSPPPGASPLPGLEVAGTIAEVGDDVTTWRVGQQVCALLTGGGYAQRVAVPAGQVLPIPGGLSPIEAAALPEVTCTVWSNVVMAAHLRPGEVVLFHGGSSGIGTMGIQLARELGATVAVTAGNADKLAACRTLGAEVLINYRERDFVEELKSATGGHGADVILDVIGAKYLARNISGLAANGRLVVIGLQGGAKEEIDLGALLAKRATLIATSLRARPDAEKAAIVAAVLDHVWPMVDAGRVKPIVHETVPLAEAARAHRILQEGHHIGKVVLTV